MQLYLALAIGGLFILIALASSRFRSEQSLWLAGLGIGAVLFLCWLLSAGAVGIEAFEESAFSETPVRSMGAQSLSFTLPVG